MVSISHKPTEILGMPIVAVNGTLRLHPSRYPTVCHGKACGCICDRCQPDEQAKAA